jgi:hypothetical protein
MKAEDILAMTQELFLPGELIYISTDESDKVCVCVCVFECLLWLLHVGIFTKRLFTRKLIVTIL